jgi:hypothetical protein
MFKDWQMERIVQTTSGMLDGDPHRRRVHSMLFRSQLQRQPISDHTTRTQKYIKQQECINLIRSGEPFNLEDTINWRYWVERKQKEKPKQSDRWTDEEIREHVQHRFDLVRDIMDYGMKEPILCWPDRRGIDGGNRAQILKLLGHDSIVVRMV